MSWLDSLKAAKSIGDSLASNAFASIEEARSRIDKVLDIEEGAEGVAGGVPGARSAALLGGLSASYGGAADGVATAAGAAPGVKFQRGAARLNGGQVAGSQYLASLGTLSSQLSGLGSGLAAGTAGNVNNNNNNRVNGGSDGAQGVMLEPPQLSPEKTKEILQVHKSNSPTSTHAFPALHSDALASTLHATLLSTTAPTTEAIRTKSVDFDTSTSSPEPPATQIAASTTCQQNSSQDSRRTISSHDAPKFTEETQIITQHMQAEQDEHNARLIRQKIEDDARAAEELARAASVEHAELPTEGTGSEDGSGESAGATSEQSIQSCNRVMETTTASSFLCEDSHPAKSELSRQASDAPEIIANDRSIISLPETDSSHTTLEAQLSVPEIDPQMVDSLMSEKSHKSEGEPIIHEMPPPEEIDSACDDIASVNATLEEKLESQKKQHAAQLAKIQKDMREKATELMLRESQLASLAKNNAKLQEQNDNLTQDKIVARADNTKLLSTIKRLEDRAATSDQLQQLLQHKEESIQGLLQEGENLSKQQMQHQQANKKLRTKTKEQELEITQFRKDLSTTSGECAKLREQLKEVIEREMREREQGRRMNSTAEQQSTAIDSLRFKLNETLEKQRSLQSTLDSAYKEIGDLHKEMAELQSGQREEVVRVREEEAHKRQEGLELMELNWEKERHLTKMQLGEAQASVDRTEANQQRRETQLKQQITQLNERLQEGEQRQSELSAAMTASTRPLLRQIEQLQMSLTQQQTTSDALEKSLTGRLKELQGDVAAQKARQRQAVEAAMDAHAKCTAMEASQMLVKQEKVRLETELEEIKTKYDTLKIKEAKQSLELNKLNATVHKEKQDQQNQILILQQQLDQERSKLQSAMESVKEKERQWALLRQDNPTPSPTGGYPGGLMDAINDSDTDTLGPAPGDAESLSDMSLDHRSFSPTARNSEIMDSVVSKTTAYEAIQRKNCARGSGSGEHGSGHVSASASSTRHGSSSSPYSHPALSNTVIAANVFESMQAQLKLREGELNQLLQQIEALKRSRNNMAEEIVSLSNQNESLEKYQKECDELRQKIIELNQHHNLTLTMFGEKTEECEELKLDLQDVKVMFRQQTEEMLARLQ